MSPQDEQDDVPGRAVYRIDDLAHRSGATVRTIRAYQDRGLLPSPERRGRANVYSDAHLTRLRQIADLLDRGYTLASIKELLEAWDTGRGLGGVLGLAAEVEGPWTDEENLFRVPSPQELALAAELRATGVPLSAIAGHPRELRETVEHIAPHFLEFTTEPLAQQTVDAERKEESCSVLIRASTIRAVERLVGPEQVSAFVTAAAEREVQARTLDTMTANKRLSG
ncbi:MerR family transcriptional regulator [Streptomyces sp. MB09-02B]|uniref:MerR family transcriptional regulator n=1 Tax=Streptomyces sp. MB09-02B TaxID=3028667 RepID=UPI0029B4E535|nr:MerR family transcriptional regulator [Streptomyces sp. MB09-02B]MDX3637975.1 MerR family transcriptional regulator [Streptomyces sp. MB09-02B]